MAERPRREDRDYNTGHFLMSVGGFKSVLDSFVLSHGDARMKRLGALDSSLNACPLL